jgi:hypothetical protein
MEHDPQPSARTIDKRNKLSEHEIKEIVDYYETVVKDRTMGPQLEGLEGSQIAEALRNDAEDVLLVDIPGTNDEVTMKWPLLINVKYHQDYSQQFFESHFPNHSRYYLSLPPYESIESFTANKDSLEDVAQFLKDEKTIVAYDYHEGDEVKELAPALLNEILVGNDATARDVTPESMAWGREYGLPLALHYEGTARLAHSKDKPASSISESAASLLASGEIERSPKDGITILDSKDLLADDSKILKRLWDIYEEQFDILVNDHPLLGKQPAEEFNEMLLDEDTLNVVFMSEGDVAGLLYMVHDIEKCVWLNKDYFDKEFENETDNAWLTHIPGIVVAKEKAQQGAGYAQEMMHVVLKTVAGMNKDMIITFACSNVSAQYIPKIVNATVGSSSLYDFDKVDTSAEYGYRVLEVN